MRRKVLDALPAKSGDHLATRALHPSGPGAVPSRAHGASDHPAHNGGALLRRNYSLPRRARSDLRPGRRPRQARRPSHRPYLPARPRTPTGAPLWPSDSRTGRALRGGTRALGQLCPRASPKKPTPARRGRARCSAPPPVPKSRRRSHLLAPRAATLR